jgi:peroxiredoxin
MIRCPALTGWLLVALALATPSQGGEFNRKLSVGDAGPAFKDLEGVDGKKYALEDFKAKDLVVIVIMSVNCPVSQDYEDRVVAFTKKYAADKDSKVAVVGISVSKEEEDDLTKMKERAKKKGFNFTLVQDLTQKIGRDLGATVTPQIFVLNKERKVIYMGAMDDDQFEPKVNYLDQAIDAALKGETPKIRETRPIGCSVEYKK